MSVIIVHGTHNRYGNWWLETTPGDFAEQLDAGQTAAGSDPDVLHISGEPVGNYPSPPPV